MRGRMIVIALSGLLAVGAATLHASRSEPLTLTPPVPAVEDRVATLERTVEALNQKVAALEAELTLRIRMQSPANVRPTPRVPSAPNDLPPGSEPLEYNGMTFYIVPLDAKPPR